MIILYHFILTWPSSSCKASSIYQTKYISIRTHTQYYNISTIIFIYKTFLFNQLSSWQYEFLHFLVHIKPELPTRVPKQIYLKSFKNAHRENDVHNKTDTNEKRKTFARENLHVSCYTLSLISLNLSTFLPLTHRESNINTVLFHFHEKQRKCAHDWCIFKRNSW